MSTIDSSHETNPYKKLFEANGFVDDADQRSAAAFKKQFGKKMAQPLVRSAVLGVEGTPIAVDAAQHQYALHLVTQETGERPVSVEQTFAVEDQLAVIKDIDSRGISPKSAE